MQFGQGSRMALPICGIYLQKVFGDTGLGYSSESVFDIPEDFDPCGGNGMSGSVLESYSFDRF